MAADGSVPEARTPGNSPRTPPPRRPPTRKSLPRARPERLRAFLGPLSTLVAALLILIAATPQGLASQQERYDASGGAAAIGAIVGGTVGLFAGAYVGSQEGCTELCLEIFTGALVGEIVGVALGAHVFNGARGSFWKDLGTSAGAVGIGLVGSALADSDEVFIASLVGQVIAVSIVEVRTSPRIEPVAGVQRTPRGAALRLGLRIR